MGKHAAGTYRQGVWIRNDVWVLAGIAARREGTTRSQVAREALYELVARHPDLTSKAAS